MSLEEERKYENFCQNICFFPFTVHKKKLLNDGKLIVKQGNQMTCLVDPLTTVPKHFFFGFTGLLHQSRWFYKQARPCFFKLE